MSNYWESYYKTLPLDQIPWQRTQADWFKRLVDKKIITGNTALDLGCGTGKKCVYLASQGDFEEVVGVDISPSAIAYAMENARDEKVTHKVKFFIHDVTDLSFLKEQAFDFILDWAVLHCIEHHKRLQYIKEIVKRSHKDSLLLLRVFSKRGVNNDSFTDSVGNEANKIYLFNDEMINELYGNDFTILERRYSRPRTKDNLSFREYLMRRAK